MMNSKKILSLLLALAMLLLLAACGGQKKAPVIQQGPEVAVKDVDLSHYAETTDNARVFYEIFVGSFSDSDGDGVGDLRGIIDRFDYLNDGDPASGLSLGVEGLWLTPIFASPSYHKYDVTDYYAVDPAFGSLEDLKELAALCQSRNVKLILDLPINHTGIDNAWFKSFGDAHRRQDAADPYYDFYTWCPADRVPEDRVFAPISGTGDCYECNFDRSMPELNFDDPAVRQAVLDVAKFYLDLGVDGFRFDAAKYVYFGDHANSTDFWDWYMEELRRLDPEIYAVAEVWDQDGVTDQYYSSMNCFDFTLAQSEGLVAETVKGGEAGVYTAYVERYLKTVRAIRPDAMIVPFVSNHDMDRAAGFLPPAAGQMQMAANLYILGPGSPFLYYGEEIGMKGSRGGEPTDANRRLAMLWGDGDTVADPVGSSYSGQTDTSAARQKADEDSLYQYYKRLILIRRANPEIARGEYRAVAVPDSAVGGFVSTLEGSSVLVLHNPAAYPQTVDLAALGLGDAQLTAFIGQEDASLDGSVLTLGAQTSAVLR